MLVLRHSAAVGGLVEYYEELGWLRETKNWPMPGSSRRPWHQIEVQHAYTVLTTLIKIDIHTTVHDGHCPRPGQERCEPCHNRVAGPWVSYSVHFFTAPRG